MLPSSPPAEDPPEPLEPLPDSSGEDDDLSPSGVDKPESSGTVHRPEPRSASSVLWGWRRPSCGPLV